MPELTLAEVLAKAHELALENEREIVKQVAIREKEVSELNKQITGLSNLIEKQTMNINNLAELSKGTVDLKELIVKNGERVEVVETFMLEEKRLHICEEAEKKEALKTVLQEKDEAAKEVKQEIKDAKEPKTKLFYGILQQLIWLALVGIIGYFAYLISLIKK